jgi:hypothetical protein
MAYFVVGFESFKVENCRSKGGSQRQRLVDHDGKRGQDSLSTSDPSQLGNLHASDEMRDVFVGPIDVPDRLIAPDAFVVSRVVGSSPTAGSKDL